MSESSNNICIVLTAGVTPQLSSNYTRSLYLLPSQNRRTFAYHEMPIQLAMFTPHSYLVDTPDLMLLFCKEP